MTSIPLLRLPDSWVSDFWPAYDSRRYHMFFLFASRALETPLRHERAAVGHAVSTDRTHWIRAADAIVPTTDQRSTISQRGTGPSSKHPEGTWFMFYTGGTRTSTGVVQTHRLRDLTRSAQPRPASA